MILFLQSADCVFFTAFAKNSCYRLMNKLPVSYLLLLYYTIYCGIHRNVAVF